MNAALIVHAEQDSAAAVGVCAIMPEARTVPLGAVAVANRTPLILLWSAHAAAESLGERFAALALAHMAPVALCRLDAAELGADLDALRIATFNGALSGKAFLRAAHDALAEARRHGPVRRRSEAGRGEHAFAVGLARGFTSSVAVLGLGGVVAVGAAHKDMAAGAEGGNPLQMFSASAAAATLEDYGPHHIVAHPGALLSDAEMREAIADLQADAASDQPLIQSRLADAQSDLTQRAAATDHVVRTLETISTHPETVFAPIRARPIAAQPMTAAAPPTEIVAAPQAAPAVEKSAAVGEGEKSVG
ncbi:MAG: hypothetical protein AB7L65_00875 [Hyphomonadaceae bacterium]